MRAAVLDSRVKQGMDRVEEINPLSPEEIDQIDFKGLIVDGCHHKERLRKAKMKFSDEMHYKIWAMFFVGVLIKNRDTRKNSSDYRSDNADDHRKHIESSVKRLFKMSPFLKKFFPAEGQPKNISISDYKPLFNEIIKDIIKIRRKWVRIV